MIHERLSAVLDWPHADLTSGEAAELLGLHRSTISRSVQEGEIEGMLARGRGRRQKLHFRLCKAAVIKWMWDNTTGDRAMMRAELAARAPALLAVLEAQAGPHTATGAQRPPHGQRPQRRAAMTRHSDHPELFDLP